ncbi:MAG: nickel-dependent lactate racemase [Candidatus Hydrogenedentes bacterium]|nr:nickel-dependent lactate racemase [Candidatus Hydrogenedentota bacterium]
MRIDIPYGPDVLHADLDWARLLGTLVVPPAPSAEDPVEAVRRALDNPIGQSEPLRARVKPGEKILVVVSDQFRQTRADVVLPVLLDELRKGGGAEDNVHVLFATGIHRPPEPDEQARVLGAEMYARLRARLHVHDPFDSSQLVRLGVTSRGTPVLINRLALDADRVIATGAVVFHYFAGFGGGRKSIVPGIAGAETIAHNHALNLHPRQDTLDPAVRTGALDGNPVAEDMFEAARLVPVDSIVNTVLDREGRVAGVFAGELDAAHRAGAEFARGLFSVTITEQADLVIATSGDARNFVQAHKALHNAWQAMKPGGRIAFVAHCNEGLGGEQFVKWLRLRTREAIFGGLRRQSEINGQTALSSLEKCPSAIFVTQLSDEDTRLLGARKAESLDAALSLARQDLGGVSDPTAYLMPHASYSVPFPPA